MRRFIVALVAIGLGIMGLSAGVAVAQPGTAACSEAFVKVDIATRAKLAAETALVPLNKAVVDAQAAVDAAIKADNAVKPPLTQDSAATVTAKAILKLALDAVVVPAKTLADAIVALNVAIGVRNDACKTPPTTTITPTPAPGDIDCDDVSKKAAQDILDKDKTDPNNLDVDGDGVACEEGDTIIVRPNTDDGVDTGEWQ